MNNAYPNFGKRTGLKLFSQYKNIQEKLHDLTYLFWECTLRCNLNCLHCGSDCHKNAQVKDLPAEDFLNITAQISKKYNPNKIMIVVTGGEPLMRQDLEFVGLELYKQGYPWGFVTNGYNLTRERFNKLLMTGLRSVTVSLDGFEQEHNWLRGKSDSYRRALNAIQMIIQEEDLVYDVVTCVNQRNFEQLNELKEFLVKQGVKHWRLFTIFPIGRAKAHPLLDINNEHFTSLMEFIKQCREEGKIKASYGCEGFLGKFEKEVRDGYFFCRAGINIASLLADGSIGACPNINHAFVQGNIHQDNFLEVWENRFDVMRNREWTKTGVCAECKVFKYCKGNGMHLHEPDNPEVLRCHFNMLK